MLTVRQSVHAVLWAHRLLRGWNYPVELSFIKESLTPEDVCFDVGAHSGSWSYPLSKIVRHVYAFEALPYYAQILSPTMRLLGARNVTVVNKAVSDRKDTVNLTWLDSSGKRLTGFTHVAAAREQSGHTVNVETVPLDSFIADETLAGKRIAFIKCDVEGYECHVIAGARRLISQWRPLIFAEAKDDWFGRYGKTSTDLIDLLASYDYSASVFRAGGTPQEVTAATYSGSGDILFRPRSS
jgi:FkbM family methyltransferase